MIANRGCVTLRNICLAILQISFLTFAVQAKKPHIMALTPPTQEQTALLKRAIANEKVMERELQKRIPMVQTYIQNVKPDADLATVPVSDKYILSRVDFGKSFEADGYRERSKGLLQGSKGALGVLSKALGLTSEYVPTGFMDMMFIDTANFDRQHYNFGFVRNDFLGTVHTQVFDVLPKEKNSSGRFTGRIWIEDQDGAVVRVNGIFSGNAHIDRPRYFHFDSWRVNLQPGVWLPAEIYVEETHGNRLDDEPDLRAQTSFWGYSLKLPSHEAENTAIQIDNVTDNSDQSQDVSPLQAKRAWVAQAEANVLDRLVQAGILAAPSDFDKVLETVTNNLIIGNNLQLPDPVHCRVLLTAPLESLAVGNTILLSRGLIDVLPYEEDLAAVLSFQLAHITLGHHIDTRYAFNDRLLFPDEVTFQRITMNHSLSDDSVAAKKAIEFLNKSVYHDHLANAGLFFAQLQSRSRQLKALTTPRIGDSLLSPDGTPWLAELTRAAPKLDVGNLDQVAALPLGSHLKVDAWDDKVLQLNAKPAGLLTARDKMPFEVTPILFRLTRYADPALAAAPATTGAGPAITAQTAATGANTRAVHSPQ
jgi:hypothetical protein